MEKNLKKIKRVAILLIAVLISIIAFGGLYIKEMGVWKNILPDFNLGMELSGMRELRFVLDTSEEEKQVYVDEKGNILGEVPKETEPISLEENKENKEVAEEKKVDSEPQYAQETRKIKANSDESINIENFEKTKKIIQNRLETIQGYEYNIRMNTITGELIVEVPDDENIELEKSLITTVGKFEIIDKQTGIILMNNSDLKNAKILTSTTENGYQAYLQLKFNNQGIEKLKEISKKYVATTDASGTEKIDYVTVELDGQEVITTYFGEEISNGEMQIPMGEPISDINQYKENESRLGRIANIISEEKIPLVYTLNSDNYIKSFVTENIRIIIYVIFTILVIAVSVYMLIKFRLKGLKGSVIALGYISTLLLIIRYTKVDITLNSLIALISVIAINYFFTIKLLQKLTNKINNKLAFKSTMKELYLTIIPVCIVAVIFTFMSSLIISSVGMILFWGLLVQALYNALVILAFDAI